MADDSDDTGSKPVGVDPIVGEAMDLFDRAQRWESFADKNWLDDYKFANGDSINNYQWADKIRNGRISESKPCLTINKTRQHNLQIINDSKQNKPAIKIRPTGNGSSYDSSRMYAALARHIEYRSKASMYYDQATTFQVNAGVGYLRLITDYVSESTFDQEILIRGLPNPLMVKMDPDAKEPDKSDSNFCFIFEDVQKKEFAKKYPKWKSKINLAGQNAIGDQYGWMREDYIRVAEFYRRRYKQDTLFSFKSEKGQQMFALKSLFKGAPDVLKEIEEDPQTETREVTTCTVHWYFIIGVEIVDEKVWPGKYIPVIPVIGEETIIEGRMDRKGHTRALRDPQSMYNYWSSAAVEFGALQSKTPYIAPAEAVEGYEVMWNNANRQNYSVLLYNGLDDAGQKIEPPRRQEPPVAAPVAITGMQVAQNEMAIVSGQFGQNMGEPGTERTGKAINERQRVGENATYHFIDNLSMAIRQVGRIIIDIAPKIYDTPRLMQIADEDGSLLNLIIDPQQQQAYQQRIGTDGKVAQHILNPQVGLYEVEADIGPDYGTRRQETFNALSIILTQAPQLTSLIGDLLLKSADFNLANEAAERLRRMVPAHALGEGPSQNEQMMMAQIKQLTDLLANAMEELTKTKAKVRDHAAKRDVDIFNAITTRLKTFLDAKSKEGGEDVSITREELDPVIREALVDAMQTSLDMAHNVSESSLQNGGSMPTAEPGAPELSSAMPGQRTGADGRPYMRDYSQSTNYRPV